MLFKQTSKTLNGYPARREERQVERWKWPKWWERRAEEEEMFCEGNSRLFVRRWKVELPVITKGPWIRAIIKCEPWTKVSLGIKCFLERRHATSSQSPANDKQQRGGENGGRPMSGHFWGGVGREGRRDISILAFIETGPRNRSAEYSNTAHTSD